MRSEKTGNQPLGGRLESSLLQLPTHISKSFITLVVNLLILGGVFGLFFYNDRYKPVVASAAILDEIPPDSTIQVDPPRPSPTLITPSATPSPTASLTPTPTVTPALPAEVRIKGIKGRRQSLPLSCESRSAVDWAAYFEKTIDEIDFFEGLPVDDNPEKGFVGDVHGSWGQIPPDPYGVHAKPVAQRLREYGLNAKAVRHMTWEEIQAELAAGRPVILWVVGHVARGTPVPFTAADGEITTVAKFQHTVIAIGYTEIKITLLDGSKIYTRYKKEFLKSWGVLENQAVVWID